MNGADVRRLTPGTVTFQMRLHTPTWSYDPETAGRLVDVEVEIGALLRLSDSGSSKRAARPTLNAHRTIVEQAARRIIDREGPNFTQPVRVSATDLGLRFSKRKPDWGQVNEDAPASWFDAQSYQPLTRFP